MDTTIRINILLILLLGFICGYVVKESIIDKKPAAVYTHARALPSEEDRNAKAIANKVLNIGTPVDYKGRPPVPPSVSIPPLAAPVVPRESVRPIALGLISSASSMQGVEYRPVPQENRLYQPKTDEGKARKFTKTKRGQWMAPPQGFFSATTNNYVIYREEHKINKDLQKRLEDLHGNFVLDITPFSLFSKFDRILLMLFVTKDNYTTYTSMPDWSNAAADVDSHAVYIMENGAFSGNFIHELTHIYYDGFFKPSISPLWLSEGMAVRMQSGAQTSQENAWLAAESQKFKSGEYIVFKDFTEAQSIIGYDSKDALIWYAQAYSVVDYLLKHKSRDEFYQFSKNLKEGMPIGRAMYRAYGMPFNNINALEYAWQADLQKKQGPRRSASPAQGRR